MRNPLKFIEAKDIRYGIIYKQVLMIFEQFGLFIDQLPCWYKKWTGCSTTSVSFVGTEKSSMQRDCVSKKIGPRSNKSVDSLYFLWNYLSWEIYSVASHLVIMDLIFDLFWFRVDIFLKQSLFVIWTDSMIIIPSW